MTAHAQLTEEREDPVAVARLEGEVDASNVDWIGDRLRAMVGNRDEALTVDLRRTSYVDSAGIALLFALGSELRARRQALQVLVAPGSGVERLLAIVGLPGVVTTPPR